MRKYKAYLECKDSGVEWLGQIPAHWSSTRLRFLLSEGFANGLFKKKDEWGTGTRIINVFDVYTADDLVDEKSLDRVECSESEAERYSAEYGDFFFVRSSLKLEGIGKSATLLDAEESMVFECHLVRGRPDLEFVSPKFLNYYLNCDLARQDLISKANQVTMTTIDQSKFKDLWISIPDLDEQDAIARFLDYETTQIDELIAEQEALIEKFKEYRTALITNAVTGAIDVRDVEIPAEFLK